MRTQLAVAGLAAMAVAGGALFVARHGSAGPSNVQRTGIARYSSRRRTATAPARSRR